MGDLFSWVIAPAYRVNICKVNAKAFKRFNSSQIVSDSLEELICIQTINMSIANKAILLLRAAWGD